MAASAASSSLGFHDDLLALRLGEMMLVAMIATPMTALDLAHLNAFVLALDLVGLMNLVALVNLVVLLHDVTQHDHHHRDRHQYSRADVVEV